MSNDEIFSALKKVGSAVAMAFGPACEVAVCDLRDSKIVSIENGHVTGRKVGGSIAKKVYEYFINYEESLSQGTVYFSQSFLNGKMLKCSSTILQDKNKEPLAIFSINLDVEGFGESVAVFESLVSTEPVRPKAILAEEESGKTGELTSVVDYTKQLMGEIIRKIGKPLPLNTKEGKLLVLKKLEEQGVLLVRDMVPAVCDILSISQATLYNYLRELHGGQDKEKSKTGTE